MLNFTRQKIFTDSFSFTISDGKANLDAQTLATSVVIVGVSRDEKSQKALAAEFPILKEALAKALAVYNFKGKYAETALVTDQAVVLFVGLGEPKDFNPRKLLNAGGKIWQACKKLEKLNLLLLADTFFAPLKSLGATDVAQDFAGRPLFDRQLTKEEALDRLLCGFFMASFKGSKPGQSAKHKQSKKDHDGDATQPRKVHVVAKTLTKEKVAKLRDEVVFKSESITWIREETHLPANVLTPDVFAKEIRALGEASGFKTKIFLEDRLQSEGFNGIWSVGKGSIHPPRLVQMEYNATLTKAPHLVLIGKGVTFDTGGISIKPALNMEEMKHDMTGAAIVAGAMAYIARAKVPVRVTALTPLAENRPSHNSIVPGDVYEAWGGKTVEVQNTDAEGRLILGDCLAYAAALKPDVVIDLATLTGAAFVTLGPPGFLLYGNKGATTESFIRSTNIAGEQCWEMPLWEEYAEDLKSSCADMRNIVGHRDGNSHVAAMFLNNFVENAYPWLHLDICAYTLSNRWKGAHCPPDANAGLPLLALAQFAKDFAKTKKRK